MTKYIRHWHRYALAGVLVIIAVTCWIRGEYTGHALPAVVAVFAAAVAMPVLINIAREKL